MEEKRRVKAKAGKVWAGRWAGDGLGGGGRPGGERGFEY